MNNCDLTICGKDRPDCDRDSAIVVTPEQKKNLRELFEFHAHYSNIRTGVE